jgi:hypothetical protein
MADTYSYIETTGCRDDGVSYLIIKNGVLGYNIFSWKAGIDWLEKDETVIKEKILAYALALSDGDWDEIGSLSEEKDG